MALHSGLPWTADGDPIPLAVDASDDDDAKRSYESEPFYVLPGGTLEEDQHGGHSNRAES